MTSTIQKQYIIGTVSTGEITVPSDGVTGSLSVDASKNGYTPIGIIGCNKKGGASGYCIASVFYIDGNDISYQVRNTINVQATPTITFYVLYERS